MTIKLEADVFGSIRDKRNKTFALWKALCEIIDNSVDANASEVNISELNGDVVITDNGEGFVDIASALVIGKSTKTGDGKIGRFGVGLKDASIRFSGKTIIESNNLGCVIDWDSILRGVIDPVADDYQVTTNGITKIIWKDFIYSKSIETDKMSKIYGELISNNKLKLTINGVEIKAAPMPLFNEELSAEINYEGKKAIISGGVYTPKNQPHNHLRGYNIYYHDRMIQDTREMGVGDDSTSNFCFVIKLLDSETTKRWQLATNKDSIDKTEEFLNHVYHKYTGDMLKKAFESQQTIEMKEWEEKLNLEVNGKKINKSNDLNESRTKKDTKSNPPAEPTGEGSQHVNTKTNDGRPDNRTGIDITDREQNSLTKEKVKLFLKWEELSDQEILNIAINKNTKKCIVTFNTANEEVSKRKGIDDYFFKVLALSFYYFKNKMPADTVGNDDVITDIIKKITTT